MIITTRRGARTGFAALALAAGVIAAAGQASATVAPSTFTNASPIASTPSSGSGATQSTFDVPPLLVGLLNLLNDATGSGPSTHPPIGCGTTC